MIGPLGKMSADLVAKAMERAFLAGSRTTAQVTTSAEAREVTSLTMEAMLELIREAERDRVPEVVVTSLAPRFDLDGKACAWQFDPRCAEMMNLLTGPKRLTVYVHPAHLKGAEPEA